MLFRRAGLENCTEPCLIYTVWDRIDAIELASSRVFNLLSNLTFPANLDVHVSERTLYWSDVSHRAIKRTNMSSGVTKDIITEDHGYVGDLAVEWESRLLYWTDTSYRRIEVASLDGTKRKVLLTDSSSYPLGIAVHPKKGWVKSVKWSHWADLVCVFQRKWIWQSIFLHWHGFLKRGLRMKWINCFLEKIMGNCFLLPSWELYLHRYLWKRSQGII